MPPTLSYQTKRTQIHEDPDGTLHIDIPPMGWGKALLLTSPYTIAAVAGMMAPFVVLLFTRQREEGLMPELLGMAALDAVIVLGILIAAFIRGCRSAYISVSASELRLDEYGVLSGIHLNLARSEIEFLGAGNIQNEAGMPLYLHIRRKRYDSSTAGLGYLSRPDVEKIATLIQDKLQLPPEARRAR